jgi:hypothetical protein
MFRNEKPASNLNMWITAILAIIILIMFAFLIFNKKRIIESPQNQSSSVNQTLAQTLPGEKCEEPKGSFKSFGYEVRNKLVNSRLILMQTHIPDETNPHAVRLMLDYAEKCWVGFSFEAAGITEGDLKEAGYLPRGRRP